MTFGWTLAGTIAQLLLAGLLFMLVVFSAGGMANRLALGKAQLAILNLSMFVLPAVCVLSGGIVLYLHTHGGGVCSYGWYLTPLASTSLYLLYAAALRRHGRAAG